MAEVNKVMLNIRAFGAEVKDIICDADKSQMWLKNLHDCLLYGIEGISSFGDAMRKEAIDFTMQRINNGRKGGISRAINAGQIIKQSAPPSPPTKEEVYAFAEEHHLDDIIAREWFEMHQERGFKDKNGKSIVNWKGALTRYCKAREDKL